jgi:photosystem II stability/assembly factor-like uncharacterized protein
VGGLPTNRTVNGFAVDPTNAKVMYVAMRDGLFKSTDAGETWKRGDAAPKTLAAVAVHPKRPAEVYVATMTGIVWKSLDDGATWFRAK